jgi:hypothetical protein
MPNLAAKHASLVLWKSHADLTEKLGIERIQINRVNGLTRQRQYIAFAVSDSHQRCGNSLDEAVLQ